MGRPEQRKKVRTTAKTASESPPALAADAFTAALAAVPTEDWDRTWVADKTIMLRMTSKGVKELLDKMRPSAVVRWKRSFLEIEEENSMLIGRAIERRAAEKLQIVLRHLVVLTAGCRITTLELFFEDA